VLPDSLNSTANIGIITHTHHPRPTPSASWQLAHMQTQTCDSDGCLGRAGNDTGRQCVVEAVLSRI